MGSDICIYGKTHQDTTQTICTIQHQSVRHVLGLLKHVVYSFALERYPYNMYIKLGVYKGYKKIGSITKHKENIYIKLPCYHVQFLNCMEEPLGGVQTRTESFETSFVLQSHDHYLIHFVRAVDL